jgi:hypothetical protein
VGENGLPVRFNLRPNFLFFFFFHIDFFSKLEIVISEFFYNRHWIRNKEVKSLGLSNRISSPVNNFDFWV